MSKYRIISIIASALAAAMCFYTYYVSRSGGEANYGVVFIVCAAAFAVIGTSELKMSKEKGAAGAAAYYKPAFFYVISLLAVGAAVWFFIG